MCDKLIKRRNRGIVFSIIVVAEGAKFLGHNITQEQPAGEDSPAPRLGVSDSNWEKSSNSAPESKPASQHWATSSAAGRRFPMTGH